MTDMSIVTKEWITVAEAAAKIRCSTRTVLRMVDAGTIRKFEVNPRLYFVHVDDVERESQIQPTMGRPRGS